MASSSGESIKVSVRCRPLFSFEQAKNFKAIVNTDEAGAEISVPDMKNPNGPPKRYTFDATFGPDSLQKNVYNQVAKGIVDSVLEGYNGTIFAYGQSGTGKTHTMEGKLNSEKDMGIIPRAFTHIFDSISNSKDLDYLVRCSMFEIYKEDIYDLLGKDRDKKLEVREQQKKGFFVKDLEEIVCKTKEDQTKWLMKGNETRSTGVTDLNEHSSRSHALFVVKIESKWYDAETKQNKIKAGKLNLVDLAGSECINKTNAVGERKEEGIKINQSLSTLRGVITDLLNPKATHVRYRDSKLTRLLQDSLGGNTKTYLIAAIGPADDNIKETISTLQFASGAKKIQNKPKINEDPVDAKIREFQGEIEQLKAKLLQTTMGKMSPEQMAEMSHLMGKSNNANDMDLIVQQRENHLQNKVKALESRRNELASMEKKKNLNAEAAQEQDKIEMEIAQYEAKLESEKLEMEKLKKKMEEIEDPFIKGKNSSKVTMKKQEYERILELQVQEDKAHMMIEKKHDKELGKKSALENRAQTLQAQLTQMDKEVSNSNNEIAELAGKMAEFKESSMITKEENKREKEMLARELKYQESIIKSLVPASVETILTSMIDWDDVEEKWDLNAKKKAAPRFDKPFSLHGVKRPTAMSRRNICEYQNFFLLKKDTINFHLDKELNTRGIFNDDEFMQAQISKSINQLDAHFQDDKDLNLIKKETEDDLISMSTAATKTRTSNLTDSPPKDDASVRTKSSKNQMMKKVEQQKQAKKIEEEEFPEAKGKFKKRPLSRIN